MIKIKTKKLTLSKVFLDDVVVQDLSVVITALSNVVDFYVFCDALYKLSAALVVTWLSVAVWVGAGVLTRLRELD